MEIALENLIEIFARVVRRSLLKGRLIEIWKRLIVYLNLNLANAKLEWHTIDTNSPIFEYIFFLFKFYYLFLVVNLLFSYAICRSVYCVIRNGGSDARSHKIIIKM